MLCTATQPVCDMMRDCTLKPASIHNRIVCHWSSCWAPFCVNCDPKDTNPIWWKFWSNRANLVIAWWLRDSVPYFIWLCFFATTPLLTVASTIGCLFTCAVRGKKTEQNQTAQQVWQWCASGKDVTWAPPRDFVNTPPWPGSSGNSTSHH